MKLTSHLASDDDFGEVMDKLAKNDYDVTVFSAGENSFLSSTYNNNGMYNNYTKTRPEGWMPLLKKYQIITRK